MDRCPKDTRTYERCIYLTSFLDVDDDNRNNYFILADNLGVNLVKQVQPRRVELAECRDIVNWNINDLRFDLLGSNNFLHSHPIILNFTNSSICKIKVIDSSFGQRKKEEC